MQQKKLESEIKKLDNVKDIIQVSKFKVMGELQYAYKVVDSVFSVSYLAKELILMIDEKYWVSNKMIKENKDVGNVYVYLTSTTKDFLHTSYEKHEKMILKEYNTLHDKIIVVGQQAIEFARENKMDIIFETLTSDGAIDSVASVLNGMYMRNLINKIKFVCMSARVGTEPLTILPFKDSNVNFDDAHMTFKKSAKYKYYPSILDGLQRLSSMYIRKMTTAIFTESDIYYLKNALVRHDQSINAVDDRKEMIRKKILKSKRKIQTEEMIFVSQISKVINKESGHD